MVPLATVDHDAINKPRKYRLKSHVLGKLHKVKFGYVTTAINHLLDMVIGAGEGAEGGRGAEGGLRG